MEGKKTLKWRKSKHTKNKKIYRRLISLFCYCFMSQEKNEEIKEMEQSIAEKNKMH